MTKRPLNDPDADRDGALDLERVHGLPLRTEVVPRPAVPPASAARNGGC